MRITKWGEYGLLCALYIARNIKNRDLQQQQLPTAAIISDKEGIPFNYTQQILHRLKVGGIIKSVRGPKGGYVLAKVPQEITVRDVLDASEGQTFEVMCDTGKATAYICQVNPDSCVLKELWYELKEVIDNMLSSYTLEDLLNKEEFVKNKSLNSDIVNINLETSVKS